MESGSRNSWESKRRESKRRSAISPAATSRRWRSARWLAAEPKVLILDEPTQGIDVGAKAEIHRLMGQLPARGLAILMISSELPEILGMSDRIAVMHTGAIAGTLEACRSDARKDSRRWRWGIARSGGGSVNHSSIPREICVALAIVALLLVLAVFSPAFFRVESVSRDLS